MSQSFPLLSSSSIDVRFSAAVSEVENIVVAVDRSEENSDGAVSIPLLLIVVLMVVVVVLVVVALVADVKFVHLVARVLDGMMIGK